MKKGTFAGVAAVWALVSGAAVEIADGVQVSRDAETDRITVSYSVVATEGESEGIVTAKLLDKDGVELPGALAKSSGDAFRRVKTGVALSFSWLGDATLQEGSLAGASVKLSAWDVTAPPDYMVVDLAAVKDVSYYEHAGQVPGGVKDMAYLRNKLLMRKIPAAGVKWNRGSATAIEYSGEHGQQEVTLTDDYYMGVFEVTQWQYWMIDHAMTGANPKGFETGGDPSARTLPVQTVNFGQIRGSDDDIAESSWLGLIRARTGLPLDLPTQAQWEYACRAGTSGATYGPLSSIAVYTGAARPAPGGSKLPNNWGLYDTIGNMFEFCLDWIDPEAHLHTEPETNPTGPTAYIDFDARCKELGVQGFQGGRGNAGRMWCGGCFSYGATYANATMPYGWGKLGTSANVQGFRVCCVIK